MSTWRIPIALKLFLTVVFATLLTTILSLGVFHWSMQKNFARYVAQVEMRKLEHLNNNLAEIYQVYDSWQAAIDQNLNDAKDQFNAEEHQRLTQRWLRRQYDIAQQQSELLENPALFQQRLRPREDVDAQVYVPSHFDPFMPNPQLKTQALTKNGTVENSASPEQVEVARRWFMPMPDRLGLGNRLALYDANKQFITGDATPELPLQEIFMEGKIVGYLALRPALDADDALSINFFSHQQRTLFFITAASIALSAILALILANIFRKPLHRVLKAAQELSHGNYQHQVEVQTNDEFSDLSQTINQLASILDRHEQSRKQWVADTSHELKTPLAVLQAQIEAMQDGVRKATPEHLDRMMKQVISLKKLTQDLADLAQADAQQLSVYFNKADPWQIVLHELENFKSQFEHKNLEISTQGEGVLLMTDADRFRQIVVNLMSNSVRYTEYDGKIHFKSIISADTWQLQIDDTPLGISDEQLSRLGERFYRVDDSRTRGTGGTGLGLALSKKIAQALGGDLTFDHSPLGGLRCTVKLNLNYPLISKTQDKE